MATPSRAYCKKFLWSRMTTAVGTCASCGAAGPVGAVHVYRGAGIVLRCPHCDNVLAKIVKSDSRVWIDSTGIRALEVSV